MLLTETGRLDSLQIQQLRTFGENVNGLGADFAVCDSNGQLILVCESGSLESDWKSILARTIEVFRNPGKSITGKPFIVSDSILSAVLTAEFGKPQLFALVNMPPQTKSDAVAERKSVSQQKQPSIILVDYLSLLLESFQSRLKTEKHIQSFTRELSQAYEELALIHKLGASMTIRDSDQNYLEMVCKSLAEIVVAEGIAILLEDRSTGSLVSVAGSGLVEFDRAGKSLLLERLTAELKQGKDALLDSNAFSAFRYSWPENIQSIIAAPLYGKDRSDSPMPGKSDAGRLIGILVAVNRLDKPDFDSADIKLFSSVATNCAVFVENGRLFKDLKELFIGSLKALTSSIDAKDKYTRGHSERVASIARWIAEKYSEVEFLDQEQIHNIYIAGLLHDIGKIGISEAVLCKNGKLTDDEMEYIKKHPSIGAAILSQIKQMRNLVPAVLHHHERIDGKGYPSRLAGKDIPLAAKIIGLADSFDAMTSARPYRPAMQIEIALNEIKNNLGTQFDEKIGRVFLESNIYDFWESLQHKSADLFSEDEFAEAGEKAAETVKIEDSNAKI